MLAFQKVENALKRARELQDIGNETAALHVLYSTIMNNRFRAQGWDSVKEQVMMRFVQFCVEKEKLKYVRDGLYQYRTISHHSNIASLGKVITELRDRAESRLKAAKMTLGIKEMEKGKMDGDLEAEESPESLILCTLQIDVRDPAARAVHTPLRFVWETYKMIMDILKFSPKMEKLYHETARRACYFCSENERPMEFKRLCDGLRQNYALLLKYKSKQESEALLRPELHLETRIAQLNVASELGLWRESANTAEDICTLGIHELFMKSFRLKADPSYKLREKLLKWLAVYYEKLSMIFWVSDNYLFHALAWIKYLLHVKNFKKNVAAADLEGLCNTAVLAVLAIPTNFGDKKQDALDVDSTTTLESQKKMTNLLGHPTIPSRDILKYALSHRDIISRSSDVYQKLYGLLETEFTPLKLCSECQPLLEQLENSSNAKYVTALKRIIFHKLIVQLSKVFTSVTIEYFTTQICPNDFFEWEDAEKVVVSLVNQGHVQMRLDYAQKAIYFGAASLDHAASMRHELSNVAKSLDRVVSMIYPGQSSEERMEKKRFFDNIHERLEKEHERILTRKRDNDTRRLVKQEEQQRAEEEKKQAELQQKRVEEQKESLRREEATKRREEQRNREEKLKAKSETAQHLLDEIRKIRGSILVRGKPLEEINILDVLEGIIDLDEIEKAQEEQLHKEWLERIRLRRLEAKKMDHFIRACRQEELPLLDNWRESVLSKDTHALLELQSKCEKEHKEAYDDALLEKQVFEVVVSAKDDWMKERMKTRQVEYKEELAKQKERVLTQLKDLKIKRARERKEAYEQKKRVEAETQEKEEEERKQREALELEKQIKEEKRKKLDEIQEKQRQKELEIEEREKNRSTHFVKKEDDFQVWRSSTASGPTQGAATSETTTAEVSSRPKFLRGISTSNRGEERERNAFQQRESAVAADEGSWRMESKASGEERRSTNKEAFRRKGGSAQTNGVCETSDEVFSNLRSQGNRR